MGLHCTEEHSCLSPSSPGIEESGQRLENVAQNHLVLVSGKLALPKNHKSSAKLSFANKKTFIKELKLGSNKT